MAKFRKKPVLIDAMQYFLSNRTAVIEFVEAGGGTVQHRAIDDDGVEYDLQNLRIPTLEGTMMVCPGDWIIRGVKGEYYPCKADVFSATYEAA